MSSSSLYPAPTRRRGLYEWVLIPILAMMGASGSLAQVLDDSANVKILSAQSKTLLINNQYFDDMLKGYGLPSGPEDIRDEYLNQCGSVSIGNNFASNQLGTDITVIIVGDILNVGNSCGGG